MKTLISRTIFIPASLMLFLCTSAQLAAEERPNIVLAMADDQGWRESFELEIPERRVF